MINNRVYDFLKWFAIAGVHAIGVFYVTVARAINLPYAAEVAEILDAFGVLLAAFLAWSNYKYHQQFESQNAFALLEQEQEQESEVE